LMANSSVRGFPWRTSDWYILQDVSVSVYQYQLVVGSTYCTVLYCTTVLSGTSYQVSATNTTALRMPICRCLGFIGRDAVNEECPPFCMCIRCDPCHRLPSPGPHSTLRPPPISSAVSSQVLVWGPQFLGTPKNYQFLLLFFTNFLLHTNQTGKGTSLLSVVIF